MRGALCFVLGLCIGCSGSRIVVVKPLDADLNPYTSIVVTGDPKNVRVKETEMRYLEQRITQELKSLGIFNDVVLGTGAETSEGTLLLKFTVSDIKRISPGKRAMLGWMAGTANIVVDVLFVDAKSGDTLGSYSVTGKSGEHIKTFEDQNLSEAIEIAAEDIAEILSSKFGK